MMQSTPVDDFIAVLRLSALQLAYVKMMLAAQWLGQYICLVQTDPV